MIQAAPGIGPGVGAAAGAPLHPLRRSPFPQRITHNGVTHGSEANGVEGYRAAEGAGDRRQGRGLREVAGQARVKASKDEVADKVALIEEMKKHKLETYRLDTGEVVVITAGKAGVKVTEADDAESVDDGAEAESAH